jgi:hypothetical protein
MGGVPLAVAACDRVHQKGQIQQLDAHHPPQVRGKLTALVINDIDAGLGHFANTQITVNNQVG